MKTPTLRLRGLGLAVALEPRPFWTEKLRSLSTFFVVNEVLIFHISRVKGG